MNERPPQQPSSKEIPKQIPATFDTLAEANAFVRAFWTAVDPSVADRLVDAVEDDADQEQTSGDRTVLRPRRSRLYDNKYGVLIYSNTGSGLLSDKAITFLKGTGILE